MVFETAISMTKNINKLLKTFQVLASGRDFKKFLLVPFSNLICFLLSKFVTVSFGFAWHVNYLQVTWTLGVISLLGIWFSAPTIFYIGQLRNNTVKFKSRFGKVKESTGAKEINIIELRFYSLVLITYLQQLYD